MASRRRHVPVEDSWRMVEGEHDSFDTTILPSVDGELDEDDFLAPLSSDQPSSGFPSQLSSQSQGPLSGESQDSIRDFAKHQEDDQVILRQPFRPSVPSAAASTSSRHLRDGRRADSNPTPEPQFRMPVLDMDGDRRSSGRSSRTIKGLNPDTDDDGLRIRRGKASLGSPRKQPSRHRVRDLDNAPKALKDQIAESLPSALASVLLWVIGVVSLAFRYAQRPLAVLVAVYLCFGGGIIVQNMVTKSISTSLSPICRIPGASMLNLPFCPPAVPDAGGPSQAASNPVEFDDLMGVQSHFEQVLEKSADGVSLPMEMKRSETTVRDLRSLVRHSDIQARDELVLEFDGYIETARRTASDLQKFNTHVGSAVDAVISINRWTSRYIDSLMPHEADGGGISGNELSSSRAMAIAGWASWLFHPFQPALQPVFSERVLLDKYIEHTALVSDRISSLILEAQSVLRLLTRAEDHLSTIYDVTSRTSARVNMHRDEVLWSVWTLVGRNNARLHNLSQQLALLRQVDAQRTSAVAQVTALILELESIQAGLGDLRDRMAEPELLRSAAHRPAAIPLSVHIETIDHGVSRLQNARRRIRAAEDDRIRDALRRSGIRDEADHLIDASR